MPNLRILLLAVEAASPEGAAVEAAVEAVAA